MNQRLIRVQTQNIKVKASCCFPLQNVKPSPCASLLLVHNHMLLQGSYFLPLLVSVPDTYPVGYEIGSYRHLTRHTQIERVQIGLL